MLAFRKRSFPCPRAETAAGLFRFRTMSASNPPQPGTDRGVRALLLGADTTLLRKLRRRFESGEPRPAALHAYRGLPSGEDQLRRIVDRRYDAHLVVLDGGVASVDLIGRLADRSPDTPVIALLMPGRAPVGLVRQAVERGAAGLLPAARAGALALDLAVHQARLTRMVFAQIDVGGRREDAADRGAVEALEAAVALQRPALAEHLRLTRQICAALAAELGLDGDESRRIDLAAGLHDIGMLGLPTGSVEHPARLAPEQRRMVQEHVTLGQGLLAAAGAPAEIVELASRHHERLDGSGYPLGLAASQIGILERILAVADTLAATCRPRPWRPALPISEGLRVLQEGSARAFDPDVVDACTRLVMMDAEGMGGCLARPDSAPASFPRPAPAVHDSATSGVESDPVALMGALADLAERGCPHRRGHAAGVRRIAGTIARAMGLDPPSIQRLEAAALLHDVGVAFLPPGLWSKPGPLSEAERGLAGQHARLGERFLAEQGFSAPITRLVARHHERLDGSGYPEGLRAADISVEARVLAVADTLDALTSWRPHRAALGWGEALRWLDERRDRSLDPRVVDACAPAVAGLLGDRAGT